MARTRGANRTIDERVQVLKDKQAYHQGLVSKIQEQIDMLLNPPAPKQTRPVTWKAAQQSLIEAGLSPDDVIAMGKKLLRAKEKAAAKDADNTPDE